MKNKEIVQRLISCSDKVMKYCENMSYEQFSDNSMFTDACVYNLICMEEFAKQADDDLADDFPRKLLYGLKDRVIREYDGIVQSVDRRLLWEFIHDDLPALHDSLIKSIK